MSSPKTRRGRPSRKAVFADLDRAIGDLEAVGGLPLPAESEEIWKGIWYEETHNSTAIEGNTLILKQVRTLLEEGKAVGDKELAEYLEVQGYAKAASWVYEQAVHRGDWRNEGYINVTELREIHRLLIESVWQQFPPKDLHPGEGPGSFRKHDVHPFSGGMSPPSFTKVPSLVHDWIERTNEGPAPNTHPMYFLAERHAALERIHPYRDGNGRTGRLVLNLLLVRHGFPPAIILKRQRRGYLRALEHADRGDCEPLAEILAKTVKHGIDRFLLPALAGPVQLVPLTALAGQKLSHNALLVAAKRGRLRTIRREGKWYSSRQWVAEYLESRYKRLP
ncbi:MAG TPA: Fic family protein [Gaiellaceae bacterium]